MTARDVIAKILCNAAGKHCGCSGQGSVEACVRAADGLLNGPESVRLELAGMLNPWRPIETAPKDGKYIRHLAANGERIQPLAWAWSPNAEIHVWCGVVHGAILPHDPQPTHWLPELDLPAPPSEDKA